MSARSAAMAVTGLGAAGVESHAPRMGAPPGFGFGIMSAQAAVSIGIEAGVFIDQ
jgi:hypothetical protein